MAKRGAHLLAGMLLSGGLALIPAGHSLAEELNPAPIYPDASRSLGEQGQVMLRAYVEANGRPSKVELERSSGHERLDQAAMEALRQWRFKPAVRDGAPIATWVSIPFDFKLGHMP